MNTGQLLEFVSWWWFESNIKGNWLHHQNGGWRAMVLWRKTTPAFREWAPSAYICIRLALPLLKFNMWLDEYSGWVRNMSFISFFIVYQVRSWNIRGSYMYKEPITLALLSNFYDARCSEMLAFNEATNLKKSKQERGRFTWTHRGSCCTAARAQCGARWVHAYRTHNLGVQAR